MWKSTNSPRPNTNAQPTCIIDRPNSCLSFEHLVGAYLTPLPLVFATLGLCTTPAEMCGPSPPFRWTETPCFENNNLLAQFIAQTGCAERLPNSLVVTHKSGGGVTLHEVCSRSQLVYLERHTWKTIGAFQCHWADALAF